MKYKVILRDVNQRLDKFLNAAIKDKSRSQIQKMIKQGEVLVNEKIVSAHHFLKLSEEITFEDIVESDSKKSKTKLENQKSFKPKIIEETKDYIVLEKPIGMLSHPTELKETNTLADWLKQKHPDILSVGEEKYRAGIIHRLDRDVSGIMLACKTQKMFDHLKEQFKKRKIYKEYTALVYGNIEKEEGEIDFPIGRSREGRKMAAHPKDHGKKFEKKDKTAVTQFEVISRIKNYSLIKVIIKTGRTHQIRVHLSAFGHPVVGDQIYKIKKIWEIWRKKHNLNRMFLHASKIGFNDLKGNWQVHESPLPKKLNDYLNELKS